MNIEGQIKIMTHFMNGGEVEVYDAEVTNPKWECTASPNWDWLECTYRIKPEPSVRDKAISEMCHLCRPIVITAVAGTLYDNGYRKMGEAVKSDMYALAEIIESNTAISMAQSTAHSIARDILDNGYRKQGSKG